MLKKSNKTTVNNLSKNHLAKSADNIKKINKVEIKNVIGANKQVSSKDDYTFVVPKKYKFFTNRTLLIGAPNVGKSTFFNHITNGTASVSNMDRLTVDTNWALIKNTKDQVLIDLPGVYNLSHPIDEELVVADVLFRGDYKSITNIIGASSIQRDLYLTLQVAETGLLNNVIINMADEVNIKRLDTNLLSKTFGGVKVICAQARKSKGLPKNIGSNLSSIEHVDANIITYSSEIEDYILKIEKLLPTIKISKRCAAIMLIEGNNYLTKYLQHYYDEYYDKIENVLQKEEIKTFGAKIKQERLNFIENLFSKLLIETPEVKYFKSNKERQHKVDHVLLNKWLGIPLTILLLLAIYFITFGPYMGGSLKDLIGDKFLNGIVADKWLHSLFYDVFKSAPWFNEFMIQGVFKGLFTIISFIPLIFILFFLINLVQQVGILSRISAMLDDTFNKFGLSGRSLLNLITGFGCNVPSIMAARSSNSKKERVVSILISPFISCSARVIVYSFVAKAMFGTAYGWLAMVVLTAVGALIALLFGLIFSKTMFRKNTSFFFIEMVAWRKPDFKVIFKNIGLEIWGFIKKAATLILVANIVVWFFLHIGPKGLIQPYVKGIQQGDDIGKSFIGYMGYGLNFIMYPFGGSSNLGWVGNQDGWKMTVSLIAAFPAKEIALTNLGILFGSNANFTTFISTNIPIGLSYLVILMLYLPCVATISVMRKEGGWKIVGIHLASSLSSAYVFGLITYWIAYAIVR